MSESFPTLGRVPGALWRAVRWTGRAVRGAVRRAWKPVTVTALLFLAASRLSTHLEYKYLREPLVPKPVWVYGEYGSDKNPYLRYEIAIRLIPYEAADIINKYSGKPESVSRKDFEAALARVQPALAELRRGALLSGADCRPPEEPMPDWARLRNLARIAVYDAEEKLRAGRIREGIGQMLDAIEMGGDVPRGGDVIGLLVGYAIRSMGHYPLHRALSDGLPAAECRTVARRLERLDSERPSFRDVLERDYSFSRTGIVNALWGKMEEGKYDFYIPGLSERLEARKESDYRPSLLKNLRYEAEAALESFLVSIPGVKSAVVRDYDRAWKVILRQGDDPYAKAVKADSYRMPTPTSPIFREIAPDMDFVPKLLRKELGDRMVARGLALMAALSAYRQERGAYPDRLEALVGGYLSRMPLDPYSEKPFRYSRKGASYLLYSVGPDTKDEGGRRTKAFYQLDHETPG
ncbi:MAG: hypothetical protein ACYC2Y_10510, partial [Armatimonadota bacterium]